jgi:hypothetical protein
MVNDSVNVFQRKYSRNLQLLTKLFPIVTGSAALLEIVKEPQSVLSRALTAYWSQRKMRSSCGSEIETEYLSTMAILSA